MAIFLEQELLQNNRMKNKLIKNILGISILEGLVATAIVGIGFVAVLQMVTYSATSINTSGERTKANYIVSMVAEDIIGHKDTHFGLSSAPIKTGTETQTITNDEGLTEDVEVDVFETASNAGVPKFAEKLSQVSWQSKAQGKGCTPSKKTGADFSNVYDDQKVDAYNNKDQKWNNIIKGDRYLRCKGSKDLKKVKIYNINYDTGEYKHNLDNFNLDPGSVPDGEALDYYFFDEAMYIGRIQINLNNGKKRKFLYFQADYKIRK